MSTSPAELLIEEIVQRAVRERIVPARSDEIAALETALRHPALHLQKLRYLHISEFHTDIKYLWQSPQTPGYTMHCLYPPIL
jgi:hypothetical protein